MHLFDKDEWEVAYCAIDTPDELLKPWDEIIEHTIDPSIPKHHRITIAKYTRDMELEDKMLERCKKANEWVDQAIKNYAIEHDGYIGG